eukprot:m.199905 g.199905  ORF g.199905 m.199905 type:complete len:687 (+) comp25183_c0_seq1:388-2448(+)
MLRSHAHVLGALFAALLAWATSPVSSEEMLVSKASTESASPPLAAPPAPPPRSFGPLYDPLLEAGVTFTSTDAGLEGLVTHADEQCAGNIHPFLPGVSGNHLDVLEEGAQFHAAWLETQPMGGAMYAARNPRVGLNNILVFTRTQRADGALAGQVNQASPTGTMPGPDFAAMQGFFFAAPAVDVAAYIAEPDQRKAYLAEIAKALEGYDAWLWNTRNTSAVCHPGSIGCVPCPVRHPCPPHTSVCCAGGAGVPDRGLLWSIGVYDTGEDSSTRYCVVANHTTPYAPCVVGYQLPIQSAGVTSYSYACRAERARIATLLGDTAGAARWSAAAADVAKNLKKQLWIAEWSGMFVRDANDTVVTTLVHDNLRFMWQGLFDQDMADTFVSAHLMNRSEFWTPAPLPSIAISDPRYNALHNANTWSGRPMGLTYQRTVRALERYGHHVEGVLVGIALTGAILDFDGCSTNSTHCHFTLEIDPMTRAPIAAPWVRPDGYGPTLLAFLEYTALRVGVVLRAADPSMGPLRTSDTLLWSAAAVGMSSSWSRSAKRERAGQADGDVADSAYAQTVGGMVYVLKVVGATGEFTGSANGTVLFTCTVGARVVTTLAGDVAALVGITPSTVDVTLTVPAAAVPLPDHRPDENRPENRPEGGVTKDSVTSVSVSLAPNAEYDVKLEKVVRSAPYTPPFD